MRDHLAHLRPVGHIDGGMRHLRPARCGPRGICLGNGGHLVGVDIGKTDMRALVQQRFADGAADPLSSAGHYTATSRNT